MAASPAVRKPRSSLNWKEFPIWKTLSNHASIVGHEQSSRTQLQGTGAARRPPRGPALVGPGGRRGAATQCHPPPAWRAGPLRLRAPGTQPGRLRAHHQAGLSGAGLPERFGRGRRRAAGARSSGRGIARAGASGHRRRQRARLRGQGPGRHPRPALRPRHGPLGAALVQRSRPRLALDDDRRRGACIGGQTGLCGPGRLRPQGADHGEGAARLSARGSQARLRHHQRGLRAGDVGDGSPGDRARQDARRGHHRRPAGAPYRGAHGRSG